MILDSSLNIQVTKHLFLMIPPTKKILVLAQIYRLRLDYKYSQGQGREQVWEGCFVRCFCMLTDQSPDHSGRPRAECGRRRLHSAAQMGWQGKTATGAMEIKSCFNEVNNFHLKGNHKSPSMCLMEPSGGWNLDNDSNICIPAPRPIRSA